jgi:uncharacterized membrane protein
VTLFEFYKTIHVLAAVAWVGAVIFAEVHAYWVTKRNTPQDFGHFVDFQAWVGFKYFPPLTILVLASGILMVIESGYGFSETWIIIGLVLWAVSVALGAGFLGPQSIKIQEGMKAGGPPDTALQQRIDRVQFAARADVVLLMVIVVDMVIKPSL